MISPKMRDALHRMNIHGGSIPVYHIGWGTYKALLHRELVTPHSPRVGDEEAMRTMLTAKGKAILRTKAARQLYGKGTSHG